jgi:hypothetical protein
LVKKECIVTNNLAAAFLASIAIIGPANAQADHGGSYHSVESKSGWSNGELPKGFSLTITVKFADGKLTYHSANDTDKRNILGLDFTAPLDGTVTPIANITQSRFNQISVKTVGPNDLEILEMKDGDVIVGSFWTFSPNGKGFVRRGVGKDPAGKSKVFEEFFEK